MLCLCLQYFHCTKFWYSVICEMNEDLRYWTHRRCKSPLPLANLLDEGACGARCISILGSRPLRHLFITKPPTGGHLSLGGGVCTLSWPQRVHLSCICVWLYPDRVLVCVAQRLGIRFQHICFWICYWYAMILLAHCLCPSWPTAYLSPRRRDLSFG